MSEIQERILTELDILDNLRKKLDEMSDDQFNALKAAFVESARELFLKIKEDIFLNGTKADE